LTVAPAKFFESTRHEEHFASRIYFITLLCITVAVAFIVSLFMQEKINAPDLIPNFGWFLIYGLIGFGVLLLYIGSVHLFVVLFERKKELKQTVKIGLYATTPVIIFGWVPKLSVFGLAYCAILQAIGLSKVHGLDIMKSVAIAVAALLIILVGLVLVLSGRIS
jgi:hypothetical protein